MFTGIISRLGQIESIEKRLGGARLRVRVLELAAELSPGTSIAVNGCCLTVVETSGECFSTDLSAETLRRTAFGELAPGARVNLERPLRVGEELGGHFVQGHVDGVGRVTRLAEEGENWWLAVRVPAELGRYIALKGAIAIDGISLTVAGWQDAVVEAAIIPFTYVHTNIQDLRVGDPVNLECDVLAKYLERLMESRAEQAQGRLSVGRLTEEGF